MRRRARQRGIVMLVVMFVLMMGTVGASLAVDAATNGLRAAGHNRTSLQTRYMAEAQLMAAAGYIEVMGPDFFPVMQQSQVPNMNLYGAPIFLLNYGQAGSGRHHAAQFVDDAMCAVQVAGELPPMQAGASVDGAVAPVAPLGGCPAVPADTTGTIGPGAAWVPQRFRVEIYDCMTAPQTMVAGEAQGAAFARLMCVMSTHGRLAVPGSDVNRWAMEDYIYDQATLQSQYEARMSIITPDFTQ